MKKWLIVIVLLFPFLATGQGKQISKMFDRAVAAYKKNDFKKADSLFTQMAATYPSADVYYNLGLTKWNLGDSCLACSAWYKAKSMGDVESGDLLNDRCTRKDSVVYDGGLYYSKVKTTKCVEEIDYRFYKYAVQGEKDTIVILLDDVSLTMDDLLNPALPVEKYIGGLDIKPEVAPEFPGGQEALLNYLANNIKYPQLARETNIQGTVYVSFVVCPSGKVTQVRLERGIGGGCDEESIRVVSEMPDWKPGMDKGKPVYSLFNIPIRYILH